MNPGIPNERKEKSIPIAGVILAGLFTIDVLLINFAEMIQTCGGLVYPFYKVGCIILLLLHFFPGLILIPALLIIFIIQPGFSD